MRLALLTLTTLTAVAASPSKADAKCAMDHQQPRVLTEEVAVPAGGGGIVVGTASVQYHLPNTGEALQKTWGFLTGRDLMQPVITVLAPGLVVYGVQKDGSTTGELTDTKTVIAKLSVTRTKVARLAAPKLKAIVHDASGSGGSRFSEATTVRLAGAAPADAVALVVLDARRTPKSWGTVTAGATEIEVYSQRRCKVVPNGTLASKAGDKVRLAWVDKYGRLSATTSVLTIRMKK